jgi:NACalpha-BTF3-like transcription factor
MPEASPFEASMGYQAESHRGSSHASQPPNGVGGHHDNVRHQAYAETGPAPLPPAPYGSDVAEVRQASNFTETNRRQADEVAVQENAAREALYTNAGDGQTPMMGMGVPEPPGQASVENLVSMGFSESDAIAALASCNGQLDQALAMLTDRGGGAGGGGGAAGDHRGGPGANPGGGRGPSNAEQDAIAQLCGMGFDEASARQALASCGGDLEQAVVMLSSEAAAPAASPVENPRGEDPGVSTLVGMGFTEEQATNALDGSGGDVQRALAYLLASAEG